MERVLIIEQDVQRMEEIRSALDGEYKLTSCSTQEEAIAILQHKIPDLVLVEQSEQVNLMDVIEFIKRSDELSQIPIIVFSDGEDEEFERKCLRLGAADFIFKPCSKVGIYSRVNRVLQMERTKKSLRAAVSVKVAEIDEMRDMAKRDPLTKLLNRAYSEEHINEYLSERRNRGTLLMIDMDDFKTINDTYGHIVGDEFLIEFANTLQALTRQDDIVCRLGGDEFVVFLKELSSHALIIEKVEQMVVPFLFLWELQWLRMMEEVSISFIRMQTNLCIMSNRTAKEPITFIVKKAMAMSVDISLKIHRWIWSICELLSRRLDTGKVHIR